MRRGLAATLAVACATATRAGALDVPKLGVFERSFAHTGSYTNPYVEVATAIATFTRPGGGTETIPLFWDGGTAWKVRFSPDATGQWDWSVSSGDAGVDGETGSFNCVASANRGGIRASASYPYHFERQDGTPFYWFGDTMWRCGETCPSEDLDRAALYHYVDVRAAQGFNYVHSNMGRWSLLLLDGGGNEGGTIWAGALGDEVNPGYFQELDTRIVYMNSKGITVGYLLGWAQDWDDFGEAKRLRYARYVAARYSAYNVVFIVSGEYDLRLTAADYGKIGQEISATDPHDRMIGVHALDSVELFADESWMSFGDYQQLYTSLHGNILGARDHNKPVVNSEYAYYLRDQNSDGTVDKPNSATLEQIRDATYDVVMAGGHIVTGWGTTYFGGARDPGKFNVDDPRNDDWEDDVQHVKTLFTGLQWWKLQPQDGLLTGSGARYCLAETGQQYVAYVRGNSGTNSLSLGGAASATYSFRSFDPRDGSYTPLADYTGTGPVTLDPPDDQDWVFVLKNKAGPANDAPTASISADKTVALPGETVTFAAVASDSDGSIASHTWHWGDGDEGLTGAPADSKGHSWSTTGDYVVYLTVVDDRTPALSADSNQITVTVTTNRPPTIAAASATPETGRAPLQVSFTASASDPEGDTLTYQWDFEGDGTYDATGQSAQYTYADPGHYDPVVRVSDGTHEVTQQLTVNIEAPLTVEFAPEADTYVDERYPGTNYGGEATVEVGGPAARREAYVRFSVDVPAGAAVTQAKLVLFATNASSESGGTVRLFAPLDPQWDEMVPTWSGPLAGSDASGDLASLGPVVAGSAYGFENLEAAVTRTGRFTFVIRSESADGAAYCSKEHDVASERPALRVTYRQDSGTGGDSSTNSNAGCGAGASGPGWGLLLLLCAFYVLARAHARASPVGAGYCNAGSYRRDLGERRERQEFRERQQRQLLGL